MEFELAFLFDLTHAGGDRVVFVEVRVLDELEALFQINQALFKQTQFLVTHSDIVVGSIGQVLVALTLL